MKASRAVVKQVRTMEELAEVVQAQTERIAQLEDRIEFLIAMLTPKEPQEVVKVKVAK